MKAILVILTISTGLLLGCQDKASSEDNINTKASSEMNQKKDTQMESEMDHEREHDHSSMNKTENVAYYTCPMESHKHIHSQEAGTCPECGMKLVAAVEVSSEDADYFGCPMPEHSHVRADEAGKCPECGMNLKPYKLQEIDED